MRLQLEEEIAALKSERDGALESRRALKAPRASAASAKVKRAQAARAQVKEAHAAMLTNSAQLVSSFAIAVQPVVVEDPKLRKPKK